MNSKTALRGQKYVTGFRALETETGIPQRTLKSLWEARKISGIRAGHRTVIFQPEKVAGDLERLEQKAVV